MRPHPRRVRPARYRLAIGAALGAAALGLAACGGGTTPSAAASSGTKTVAADVNATGIPAFYSPPRPLPAAAPGTIIRTEKVTGVPGVPAGATVWRVLFHSRSIYGDDIPESGYVVVPGGPAPAGGFPILSWAHGTTGFTGICAPSLFTSQGGVGPYLVPGLASYLRAGFVVAATDYEGLGTPGIHPYLLGASEGRGVLDAARAAHRLPGTHTSSTVIIYGHSQGGHAALFAGELAPTYAPDLHVAGVVAAAPATELSTIVSVVDTSVGQGILEFTIPVAYTWARTYRDLPLSDLFTPAGEQVAASVVPHGCLDATVNAISSRHLTAGDVFLPGAATNPVVLAHAKLNDPGRVKNLSPMLVVQGTADTTVPPALTDGYVTTMACPIGDTVDYLHVPGATHGTVVNVSVPAIIRWMTDRLHGSPAPSTCGRPGDVGTLTP
ncbi:MAG TPA: lipase family protein [Acidimicrobiales bacterium]|nr:lipase family protein [Acidimicrobiales bacterium]